MEAKNAISNGDHVVFKTEDKTKVFQVSTNRTIFFEKSKLKGADLVGQKCGTLFELQQGKLVTVTPQSSSSAASLALAESGKDNRNLVASGDNQKLTQEDILKMKEEGVSGQDIVGRLVEQSETFKTKTEFSQEKYIKKKKKKHVVTFRVLRPNSCLLLETFSHNPGKICNLRADSLSQLLSYSNVMSGSKVAVVESCQGLVLGSVMERLAGSGRVLHLYPGNDMNRHLVNSFNFSQSERDTLLEFPLNKLAFLEDGTFFNNDMPETEASAQQESMDTSQCTEAAEGDDGDGDGDGDGEEAQGDGSSDVEEKDGVGRATDRPGRNRGKRRAEHSKNGRAEQEARKQQRQERVREAATVLREKSLDSLIVATKHDPVTLLQRLLPYVAPSRPVVVFCQHKEPLVECYSLVKESGRGLQMKLAESWYREYQVLPSRTHPLMSMSGTGGYLLSFTHIES